MAALCGPGCAQPSRMRLARSSAEITSDGPVWWCATFNAGVRPPIVGVEFAQAEQWVLTARGVRCYRYRNGRLTATGPPIPTTAPPEDFAQTRSWLRLYLSRHAPTWRLPMETAAKLSSMDELVELLELHVSEYRIAPPSHLTSRELAAELEAFPLGLAELLAAAETTGG
ncbi:MAG: hypothetical protein GY842_01585 [bacterium]|nr:hypothetical protein [bacterium]